jgi:hypothetical protein
VLASGIGTTACVCPGAVPAARTSPVNGPAGRPTEKLTVVPDDEATRPVGGAGGANVELTVTPTTLDGALKP